MSPSALQVVAAVAVLFTSSFAQRTIRVPADEATIQRAIDVAAPTGDTVLVSRGTYRESISFRGKSVRVTSVEGRRSTTIEGDQTSSVVSFMNGEGRAAILEGFTIRNGHADEGGGIRVDSASPTIRGNLVVDNSACYAGSGIAVRFGSPLIENNEIRRNVQLGCGGGGTGGGGIGVTGSSRAEILNNYVAGNVNFSGGGIGLWAAGSVTIVGNVLESNFSTYGGAVASYNTSDALVANNLMLRNSAWRGSAIYSQSELRVVNNTLYGNVAGAGQGTIASNFTTAMVYRNNLVVAPYQIGVYRESGSTQPNFANNLVWAPAGTAYGGSMPRMTGINGNLEANPLLVAPDDDDFHLQRTSPCVDAGEQSAAFPIALDFDGDSRRIDGDLDGYPIVDIGIDEQSGVRAFATGCPGTGGFVAAAGYEGGVPQPDNPNFTLTVRRALGGAAAVLILGDSRERWQLGVLPFDLAGFGMPGCLLAVSMYHCIYATCDGNGPGEGAGAIRLPIPDDISLRGTVVFVQWLIGDPGPNHVPGVVSNALSVEIL